MSLRSFLSRFNPSRGLGPDVDIDKWLLTGQHSESSIASSPQHSQAIPHSQPNRIWLDTPVENRKLSTEDCIRHFSSVTAQLNRAIHDHPKSRSLTIEPLYKLLMVGADPERAEPSVVIFCRKDELSILKHVFNLDFLHRIQCHGYKRRSGRPITNDDLPEQVLFWLFYVDTTVPSISYHARLHLTIAPNFEGTKCGALISYENRQATVGLELNVGGTGALLTVEHLFKPAENQLLEDFVSSGQDESSRNSSDGSEDGDYCMVDWDVDVEDEEQDDDRHGEEVSQDLVIIPAPQDTLQLGITKPAQRLFGATQLPLESANLDWALIREEGPSLGTGNNTLVEQPEQIERALPFGNDAGDLHSWLTPIFMVSGVRGIRAGTIVGAKAYIGSPRGKAMCQVLTVILDSNTGVVPGECGSIIVNQQTNKAYGHVIGSDSLGFALVVPLHDTFAQIKQAFDTDTVFLSDTQDWSSMYPEVGSSRSDISNDDWIGVNENRLIQQSELSAATLNVGGLFESHNNPPNPPELRYSKLLEF